MLHIKQFQVFNTKTLHTKKRRNRIEMIETTYGIGAFISVAGHNKS